MKMKNEKCKLQIANWAVRGELLSAFAESISTEGEIHASVIKGEVAQ